MILWERIERWRASAEKDRTENAEMNARLNRGETVTINSTAGPYLDQREACAAELEADLRELREAHDKLIEAGQAMRGSLVSLWQSEFETARNPHPEIGDETIAAWDAARCALEARIGHAKGEASQ